MSVAYYIVLDDEEPGFEMDVNGKAVASSIEELDAICEKNGLSRLDDFMGQSIDELSDLLGEDIGLPEGENEGQLWFSPDEGIALLGALIERVKDSPKALALSEEVLEDLEAFRAVLVSAKSIGAKWHLAVDI